MLINILLLSNKQTKINIILICLFVQIQYFLNYIMYLYIHKLLHAYIHYILYIIYTYIYIYKYSSVFYTLVHLL